ncbi:hypothetical protein ACTA71_006971 [Dictyostelium dimigraforme]
MNFIKCISIIIFLIFFIKNINSQSFKPNQKQQVNALLSQLYQGNTYETMQCLVGPIICDGDTIVGININYGIPITLTVDFSVFEDLQFFISPATVSFSPNLFSRLPNLTHPATFTLGRFNTPIPEDIVLPNNLIGVTFQSIGVPIPNAFFTTGAINTLLITSIPGFSLPQQFPENNNLKELMVYIRQNDTFPSNAGSALKNLTSLTLNIINQGANNITFPTFEPFTQLQTLNINFQSFDPSNQLFDFESSINNIKTLTNLNFKNYGFRFPMEFVDLTNLSNDLSLTFTNYAEQLNKFEFPLHCSLTLNDLQISIYDIDFRNLSSLILNNVNYHENLPPASNFNFKLMNNLQLFANSFNGTLPEEYCFFGKDVINIGGNNLNGPVPDCFRCYGGAQFPKLFPNNFDNFNDSSPAEDCTSFSLAVPVHQLLKTNETTVFEYTGSNIGWVCGIESTQSGVQLEITDPNKNIKITVPPGAGNQTAKLNFGFDLSNSVTFSYEFLGPTIDSYYVQGSDIYFRGSYFSYNEDFTNIIIINQNNTFIADTQTIEQQNLNQGIGFSNSGESPISILENCQIFNVSIDVASKQSPNVSFIYFGNITMLSNISSIQLNTTGGDFSLIGEFGCEGLTDFSNPIFKINGIDVQILKITGNQINFTYPIIENAGTYELYLEVGGFSYTTEVQYIITPTFPPTPSPTPTQTSTTPTPTPTPTPTNNGDELSTSSTLSISLIYLFSILLSFIFVF